MVLGSVRDVVEGEVEWTRGGLREVAALELVGKLGVHVPSRLLGEAEIVLIEIGSRAGLKVAEVIDLEPVGNGVVVVVHARIDELGDKLVATNVLLGGDLYGIEGPTQGVRLALTV